MAFNLCGDDIEGELLELNVTIANCCQRNPPLISDVSRCQQASVPIAHLLSICDFTFAVKGNKQYICEMIVAN